MSSHIRTKQPQNQFQSHISGQARTVGQTYGERRANPVSPQTTRPAQPRPADQFTKKSETRGNLPAFDANATYRSARRFAAGAPYRPVLLDRVQEGSAPVKTAEVKKPSDNAILNFLDKIIEKPELHSQRSIRNIGRPSAKR